MAELISSMKFCRIFNDSVCNLILLPATTGEPFLDSASRLKALPSIGNFSLSPINCFLISSVVSWYSRFIRIIFRVKTLPTGRSPIKIYKLIPNRGNVITINIHAKATPTGLLTEIIRKIKYVTNEKWINKINLKLNVDCVLIKNPKKSFIQVPIQQ